MYFIDRWTISSLYIRVHIRHGSSLAVCTKWPFKEVPDVTVKVVSKHRWLSVTYDIPAFFTGRVWDLSIYTGGSWKWFLP